MLFVRLLEFIAELLPVFLQVVWFLLDWFGLDFSEDLRDWSKGESGLPERTETGTKLERLNVINSLNINKVL